MSATAGCASSTASSWTSFTIPLWVTERRLLKDTEDAGRNCGASSLRVEFGPTAGKIELGSTRATVASTHRAAPEVDCCGGPADQLRRRIDGSTERLPASAQVKLQPGETIVSICCGGGGYGDPSEREPEKVRHDVIEGLVSRERAEHLYRVALRADLTVDRERTAALRV